MYILKAFGEFIGACGFENPKEITPDFLYKRVEHNSNQNFTEIYYPEKEKNNMQYINLN